MFLTSMNEKAGFWTAWKVWHHFFSKCTQNVLFYMKMYTCKCMEMVLNDTYKAVVICDKGTEITKH